MKKLVTLILIAAVAVVAWYMYDTLRERSFEEHLARIIHLEDRREVTQELLDYLDHQNPTIQARAALTLGRIGGHQAADRLITLVTSEKIDVATAAAFGLGLAGEKKYASELLDLAYDAPAKAGAAMVEAAGRLADSSMTEVTEMLTGFLTHPSPEVRIQACRSLFRTNAKDQNLALREFIRTEEDPEVQVAALYSLVRLGVKEATPLYIEYFADADPFVRSLAVRGLGLDNSQEAIHYLTIALNDSDNRVVTEAIRKLGGIQQGEAGQKLLRRLQRENDELLLTELIQSLTRQRNEEALPDIEALLTGEPSDNIVEVSLKYLATVKHDRAITLIDSLSSKTKTRIRSACAEAYGLVGTENIVSRLGILFNDSSQAVRATAFSVLIKVDSLNKRFYIDKALNDASYVLAVLAVDKIASDNLREYLPKLVELMSKGESTHVDIRRSLVSASEPFLKENLTDTLARRLLIDGIVDPDYVVRLEAARLYQSLLDENRWAQVPPADTRIRESKLVRAIKAFTLNPYATIMTNKGAIECELLFDVAPLTVLNFIQLAQDGFYTDLIFHRVVADFVIQGGDPEGTGWGGPGYSIRDEYSSHPFGTGTVGIATSGKDTGGSQFFITHAPQPHLDARYTAFGEVLDGMEVVNQIVVGDTIQDIIIKERKQ